MGGPPYFSRQEFLCLSGNIPHIIGEVKRSTKRPPTVDLPIFDHASFRPASPPIFPLPISELYLVNSQICDRHCTYFSKVRAMTIANFLFWLVLGEFLGAEKNLRSILCIDCHILVVSTPVFQQNIMRTPPTFAEFGFAIIPECISCAPRPTETYFLDIALIGRQLLLPSHVR